MRIMQVLVNLIGNASRHTRAGEIIVTAASNKAEAIITVSDNGEGIAEELMPHLFERYTSKPPKTANDELRKNDELHENDKQRKNDELRENDELRSELDTGTGLGLFISKFIVDAHGGRIRVNSKPGVGTDVHFTVPFTLQPDIESEQTDNPDRKSLCQNS